MQEPRPVRRASPGEWTESEGENLGYMTARSAAAEQGCGMRFKVRARESSAAVSSMDQPGRERETAICSIAWTYETRSFGVVGSEGRHPASSRMPRIPAGSLSA